MQWFGGWWGHYKSFTGKTWAKQELLIWYDSLGRWSVFDIICEHDTADVITVLFASSNEKISFSDSPRSLALWASISSMFICLTPQLPF